MAETESVVAHLVAEGLAAAGLSGPLFDVDAITADLAERIAVDDGLDAFIGAGDPGAPQPFDPVDPR